MSSSPPSSLPLWTYTDLWRMERRLYRIYDIELPFSVSFVSAGAAAAAAVIWLPITIGLLGLSIATWWGAVLIVGPPALAGWAINRPLLDNKSVAQIVMSLTRYLTGPSTLTALKPFPRHPDRRDVYAITYRPESDTHHGP